MVEQFFFKFFLVSKSYKEPKIFWLVGPKTKFGTFLGNSIEKTFFSLNFFDFKLNCLIPKQYYSKSALRLCLTKKFFYKNKVHHLGLREKNFPIKFKISKTRHIIPIDFIKNNFLKTVYDFSCFFSYPILHVKDFLWNDFVNKILIQNSMKCFNIQKNHIIAELMILSETFWLLNGHYEKIQKRKNHERTKTYFLKSSESFFSEINRHDYLIALSNIGLMKKKKEKFLREERLRATLYYLNILTNKKNLQFDFSFLRFDILTLIIKVSLSLKAYAEYIKSSVQRREKFLRKGNIN